MNTERVPIMEDLGQAMKWAPIAYVRSSQLNWETTLLGNEAACCTRPGSEPPLFAHHRHHSYQALS